MSPTLAFGDDGSNGADVCWEWIVAQRWDGWRLEVVTAQPPGDFRPVLPEAAALHRWEPDEPRVPRDRGFVEVEHLTAAVDPRVALITRSWDLVAIGPRGASQLERLRLGSTADWLLREPTSPLVIARRAAPVRQVLAAADGSPHAQSAIATLAALPWIGDAVVRVVSVADGRVDPEAALRDASATLSAKGVEPELVTRQGNVTSSVVDEIEQTSPDLVVMGARGRGSIRRLVLGSTAAAIAGSTDCSLLVAHAEQGVGD